MACKFVLVDANVGSVRDGNLYMYWADATTNARCQSVISVYDCQLEAFLS